jgi:signal transduction histidine kinase
VDLLSPGVEIVNNLVTAPSTSHSADSSSAEALRLAALYACNILDTAPEPEFDQLARMAAEAFPGCACCVTFMDAQRLWFKATFGYHEAMRQIPRHGSFCNKTITQPGEVCIVADALLEPAFRDHPMVQGEPHVRAYAGAPIVTGSGHAIGTVCAVSPEPQQFSAAQMATLKALATLASILADKHCCSTTRSATEGGTSSRDEMERIIATHSRQQDLRSLIDSQYHYKYVNQAYVAYFNKPRHEIEGRSIRALFGDDIFVRELKPLLDRALAGEAIDMQRSVRFPGYGLRYMDISYQPVFDNTGQVSAIAINGHDVTALVERGQQLADTVARLEEQAAAQQRFIHIVSHDLREPVNTLINFTGLLMQRQAQMSDTDQAYLARVQQSSQRMRGLLDDLLKLVQVDQPQSLNEPVALNDLVKDVLDDLTSSIDYTHTDITVSALPTLNARPHLLRVVLQNLVSNAIKYSQYQPHPRVAITATEENGMCHLIVADNGVGVPPESLDSIFNPFKRLHSRKKFDGTGLGLTTAKRIVELHAGKIWAESTLGAGTRIHVLLPMTAPTPESADRLHDSTCTAD